MLFTWAHLSVFRPTIATYPTFVFPFLSEWYTYSRSHIICGSYIFMIVIRVINIKAFSVTSEVWSPKGLDDFISFPPSFLTPNSSSHILGTPIRSISFIELFVVEAIHENFGMIFSLLMFAIFLLCYAQCYNYLFCTMFPSPCILQHYVEYHSYVGKVTWCEVFLRFYQSSNLSSCHFFDIFM